MSGLLAGDLHPLARLSLTSFWSVDLIPLPISCSMTNNADASSLRRGVSLKDELTHRHTSARRRLSVEPVFLLRPFSEGKKKRSERPLKGQCEW